MKVSGPIGTLPGHVQVVHRHASLRFSMPKNRLSSIRTNQYQSVRRRLSQLPRQAGIHASNLFWYRSQDKVILTKCWTR